MGRIGSSNCIVKRLSIHAIKLLARFLKILKCSIYRLLSLRFLLGSAWSSTWLRLVCIIFFSRLQCVFRSSQGLIKRILLCFRRSVVNRIAWLCRICRNSWLESLIGVNLSLKCIGVNARTLNTWVNGLHCFQKIVIQRINFVSAFGVALVSCS